VILRLAVSVEHRLVTEKQTDTRLQHGHIPQISRNFGRPLVKRFALRYRSVVTR